MRSSQLKKFQKHQNKFLQNMPKRIAQIQLIWKTVQHAPSDSLTELEEFAQESHKLAGTAITLGFVDLGKRGRDIEILLKPFLENKTLPKGDEVIDAIVTSLNEISDIAPKQPVEMTYGEVSLLHEIHKKKQLTYVISSQEEDTREMIEQLQKIDYDISFFANTSELSDAIKQATPSVIIADLREFNLLDDISQVWRKESGVPLVVLCPTECWRSRLNVAQAGAFSFIQKPIEYDDLLMVLDNILEAKHVQYHVLIVDDDRVIAEHYSIVLQAAGMKTLLLENMEHLLDEIGEFNPDIVLMDLYMPDCSGIDAVCVIRQHLSHTNLPIVYISGETDLKMQMEALQVGADDFLIKPINDIHLTQAVSIRAKRFRKLSTLMDRDSLTGLINHSNLKVALERELSRARRHAANVSFAMIDIDHFKLVNDKYGHPVGDKVIKGVARRLNYRFRKTDTVARYGGEEFALVLPDTSTDIALELVNEFRVTFSKTPFSNGSETFYTTLSAGIATFPEFQSLETIIEAADSSLYLAKEKGRNRVVTHVELGFG
ncbi:diguanylate cyclase [Candidatus Enterovibrio escicola]|uniref:diguanylate cyclase n=2 Tax=Candidatus Enterovibrio escicola TaxID=1927127 RepID=UPI00123822F9|nr:diguanylate cyclase [Candidatus Enterovibrio escacola]